jgi:hypothetical protein
VWSLRTLQSCGGPCRRGFFEREGGQNELLPLANWQRSDLFEEFNSAAAEAIIAA